MNNADVINQYLSDLKFDHVSLKLHESAQYSLSAGGKRIRPVLLLTTLNMFGEPADKGIKTAAAIEMIHTYSLIHDDLPAMDDDDYRRGQLTNHKKFDEATAILAGDALLTDSFMQVTQDDLSAEQKVRLIELLSVAAGSKGMVGGQMLDMEAEKREVSLTELETIHLHKTGELIRASIVAGGIIAGKDAHTLELLSQLGACLGLIFQIKDDILDVEGNFEETGKLSSDEQNDKSTYVSLLELSGAKEKLAQLQNKAYMLLDDISADQTEMKTLIDYIVTRNK